MLAYLPPNSAIITGLAPLSSPTLSQLYLSRRTLSRLRCACLPLPLLVVCLPAFAVVVTVFTLPVKDEAETASLIAALWKGEGESGVGWGGAVVWCGREKMRGSSHISDCKESQVVYTVVCAR